MSNLNKKLVTIIYHSNKALLEEIKKLNENVERLNESVSNGNTISEPKNKNNFFERLKENAGLTETETERVNTESQRYQTESPKYSAQNAPSITDVFTQNESPRPQPTPPPKSSNSIFNFIKENVELSEEELHDDEGGDTRSILDYEDGQNLLRKIKSNQYTKTLNSMNNG